MDTMDEATMVLVFRKLKRTDDENRNRQSNYFTPIKRKEIRMKGAAMVAKNKTN